MGGKCKDHSLGRTSSGAQIGQFQESPLLSISPEVSWRLKNSEGSLAWIHGRSNIPLGLGVPLRRESWLPHLPVLSPTYVAHKRSALYVCSFCSLAGELVEKINLKFSHKCTRVTSPFAIPKC